MLSNLQFYASVVSYIKMFIGFKVYISKETFSIVFNGVRNKFEVNVVLYFTGSCRAKLAILKLMWCHDSWASYCLIFAVVFIWFLKLRVIRFFSILQE